MQSKSLIGLVLVALLAAGTALWLSTQREAPNERRAGQALFPGLKDRLNDISQVRVRDAEADQAVTLDRNPAGWGVAERAGYPANLADLRRQLIALADAELVEAKTANPDNYHHLGVQDPDAEGAASKLIELTLPDSEGLAVIVGNTSFRGVTTTFVRRRNEDQSWAASGNISMEADPVAWLAKDIIDIPAGSVHRVLINHPDGDRIELSKADPALPNFTVDNVPQGRELVSPSAGNSIGSALASLQLEDVVAAPEFEAGDAAPVSALFETFDGLRIDVRAWQVGDDARYAQLAVEFDPEIVVPPAEADAEEEGEDGEPAQESDQDPADAANRAVELAERVEGWVYRIPSYKFGNLTKRLEDLLKPLEEESGEEAAAATEG